MRFILVAGLWLSACAGGDKGPADTDGVAVDTDLAADTDDTDLAADTDPADTDVVDSDTGAPVWDTDTGGVPDTGPDPDLDGDGYTASSDCDDGNEDIHPGAVELCDGIDNDCDTVLDGQIATFFPATGAAVDLTVSMSGSYGNPGLATLRSAGVLQICPGAWFTRVSVQASDVTVRSLDDSVYTALDATGAAAGTETMRVSGDSVVVRGLVLLNNRGPIARVISGSTDVRFEGTAIADGEGGAGSGGLTIDANADVTLVAGIVKTNTSTGAGGGVSVGANATLLADGTVFDGNSADRGGALSVAAGATVELVDVVVRSNVGLSKGGALWMDADGSVTVTHGVFNDNTAAEGGALWARGAGASVTIDGSTQVRASGGGAVLLDGVGAVSVTDLLMEDNSTAGDGSAVRVLGDTHLVWTGGIVRTNTAGVHGTVRVEGGVVGLDSVLFRSNLTEQGGALSVSGGTVAVTNCTFDANEASEDGGAIHVLGGALAVTDGVWSNNLAVRGGGLFLEGGTATLDAVDLSVGADDNTPNDIELAATYSYTYDAATSVVCDLAACL